MSELSGKTVAELRELAREREVASRTEINRARKATLLEWLEAPNAETPEESPANVEEDQQVQGELSYSARSRNRSGSQRRENRIG